MKNMIFNVNIARLLDHYVPYPQTAFRKLQLHFLL